MSWRRAVADALDVRPEEGRLVAVLLLHSFFIGVPRILTSTVAMALFLGTYEASSLPWVYVGAAATIPLVGFLRLRLSTRVGLGALLATDLAAVIGMLLVFRSSLEHGDVRVVALLLPIWYEVEWVLLNLEFWGLASQLLNVRQGKRLFGLIGSGELLAGGVAGLLAPTLVARLGTENLLLVSAGSVGVCLALLFGLRRRLRARPTPAPEDRLERRGRFADLLRSRYLTLLFGLVTLSYLGYYVVDNCFYSLAHARLPGEDELASFLGVFWGAVSFVTLGSRALLSRRILSRYGLVGGLLALPAALAAGVSLVALTGAVAEATTTVFALMALTKLFDQTLRESVDRSAILVLYQPLPTGQRVRAQTAVEGIVGPAAGGLSGLTLLALVQGFGFGPVHLASLLLVVIVGWALVAVRVRREYTDVLARALSGRRLGGLVLELGDASSLAVIERGLDSSHSGEVVYCLGVLEELRHPTLPGRLERLLGHPAAEVRRDVVQRVERLGLSSALSAVRVRVASEPDPEVRGAAIKALCAIGEPADLELVMGFLGHAEPDVRLGALSGLLRHGGIEGVLAAGGPLSRMTESTDATERCFAARLIGEVGVPSFYRPLLHLLEDPEPGVRRVALGAAARVSNPRLLPAVLGQLRDPRLRSAAMAAVGAAGEAALPQLESMLHAATRSGDLLSQRRLLRLAGRVRGPRAVEFLWKHLEGASPDLRHTLLGELVLLGFRAGSEEEARVRVLLEDEVREAAEVVAAIEDVAEVQGLIASTLEGQLDRARERLFSLLAFLYPADTVARARVSLHSRSPEKRAQAVELIDSLLSLQLSDLVVPLLEDTPHEARLQRLAARFPVRRLPLAERLAELLSPDANVPWTRACAVEAAGRAGLPALVERGATDPDPLVRETASWATKQGGEPMLSTVEKVMILKSVSIFAQTPDEVLAEVASLLEEIEVGSGEVVFERGDMGAALYIVIEGSVRVTSPSGLNVELGAREIFGEMAALDPEPRSATVTATEPTRLFRLEQESLYDLMADRIEVVRGVIRVLCHRLRAVT